LIVQVAGGRFTVPVARVREVLPSSALESLADGPPDLCGTAVSQDRRVPVVDLRSRFALPIPSPEIGRIVVVRSRGHWIGLAVDAVVGMIEIARSSLQRLPREAVTPESRFFAAAFLDGEEWLILLDVDRLLAGS
jgi:purine-binding chemotaxis protein CheW